MWRGRFEVKYELADSVRDSSDPAEAAADALISRVVRTKEG